MVSAVDAVLRDSPLSRTITLHHFDGTETATRGIFSRLPQSAGELESAFSASGLNAWVPAPADPDSVAYLAVDGARFRVLDRETVGPGGERFGQSTRFQLVEVA